MTRVCILVINNFTYDTRVQKEAKSLTKADYEVTVFALHSVGLPEVEYLDGYRVERIRVWSRGWGSSLAVRLLKYLEFSIRAIWHIIHRGPAIVHAHDVDALVPAYAAARMSRARLVYDAHELWAERKHPLVDTAWRRHLLVSVEGVLARRADAVITINMSIANYLARRHRIPVPLALMHSQEYRLAERNDVLRQELGIPEDQCIVIYAGLLKVGRGLEILLEAVPFLDRSIVVLMGEDRMNGQLHQIIAARGLQDRVFIREAVPPSDVLRYIASADLGVIPTQSVDLSYHYSLENKLFHCLMAGIPVAASDQPEKRRIIETYGIGAVFDQTAPHDIARVINELLNDEPAYQAMCQRARKAARDAFNWEIESRKLLELYNRILERNLTPEGNCR